MALTRSLLLETEGIVLGDTERVIRMTNYTINIWWIKSIYIVKYLVNNPVLETKFPTKGARFTKMY